MVKNSSEKASFTTEQQFIINQVNQNNFLKSNFYFTGGTALAGVYLHHRESEDLDFFSEERFDTLATLNAVTKWSQKYNLEVTSTENDVVQIFSLKFPNSNILKVDFGYYPYQRVQKGTTIESLQVDSLLDIAINKLVTIHQRHQVKDFVDLYFLLKKFTLWDLIEGVRVKFRIKVDPITIGADCLKIETFENLPIMLRPLSLNELKSFYKDLAKQLGMRVVEK